MCKWLSGDERGSQLGLNEREAAGVVRKRPRVTVQYIDARNEVAAPSRWVT